MRWSALLLPALLLGGSLQAQPFARKDVPPALQGWVPWALDGSEAAFCPAVNGSAVCLWPGRLNLALTGSGGTFSMELEADRSLLAPLPGQGITWPVDMKLDGKGVAVVEKDGRPHVWLESGLHRVEGRFTYRVRPDSLPLPPRTALVELSLDTKRAAPTREGDLLLLQKEHAAEEEEEDALRLKVFRKLEDGIPLFSETRLLLEVSGKAREVQLVGALPGKTVPVAVWGDLPARLDRDGTLRVQVRAGKYSIAVRARHEENLKEIGLPKVAAPWPPQEIWVFQANELLRQAEITGATAIDASRTDLPEEWRAFPAFLLEADAKLSLRETRRGEPDAPPDQLALSRTFRLDLDGKGYTVTDAFNGVVNRTTRLNLSAPGELGRASVDGQDQLVTADPVSKRSGVELRRTRVSLVAEERTPRAGAFSAVGWDADVNSLALALHLPPGWRLLAAPGSDRAPSAWVSRWTLMGFFLVLVISFGAGRLAGLATGALALVTLVVCYREAGAPQVVWISVLLATAVLRFVRGGKLGILVRIWWGVSALVLVLIALPFFVRQIRTGLWPQTGRGAAWSSSMPGVGGMFQRQAELQRPAAPYVVEEAPPEAPAAAADAPAEAEAKFMDSDLTVASATDEGRVKAKAPRKTRSKLGSVSNIQQVYREYEQDPNAIVQTGAGVPNWSFASDTISWSGPVAKEHQVRLVLLSPAVNLALAFLRVILVTLLGVRLLLLSRPHLPLADGDDEEPEGAARAPAAATAVVALAFVLSAQALAAPQDATPQGLPSDAVLQELKTRLTRPAPCAPACVSTSTLALTVEQGELKISAEVHAGAAGAWPLPGPASTWVPRGVSLDGKAAAGLIRLEDGFLHLRLSPGVHQVELSGPLPSRDTLALQLPLPPKRARYSAPGFQVDGIREDGTCEGSVQLSRQLKTGSADALAEAAYEPWFEVQRYLDIGVSWRVETVVQRVTPAGVPAVLKVPLLAGMLPTGEQEVKDGAVVVTLGRDQADARWSSTLKAEEGASLTLTAPQGAAWSEVWFVRTSPLWQAAAKGIPPVRRQDGDGFVSEWRPWPGESVELTFRRPSGVPGRTLTVDAVSLESRPGKRLADATLQLDARASRTTPLTVTLPAGAEVRGLTVRGVKKPIRPEDGKLVLSLEPGASRVQIDLQEKRGMSAVQHVPRVTLGQSAVNVSLALHVPDGRWVLLTGGPSWGPAVLFWGELLVILLAASLLGRVRWSPLRTWQWVLLSLGIAQLPTPLLLVTAGWFLALALRERGSVDKPALFDLVQIALVGWTLAFLLCLWGAVYNGLLVRPDMKVSGNDSTNSLLRWYVDRTDGATPDAWVLSLPLWTYKVLMLLWALWLAFSLIAWLGWAWRSLTKGGGWKPLGRSASGRPAPPPPFPTRPVPTGSVPTSPPPPPPSASGDEPVVAPPGEVPPVMDADDTKPTGEAGTPPRPPDS